MINSDWMDMGSVVVGDQGALVGLAEQPVEPDTGGQGEQPLRHPHRDPAAGAATMAFQRQLALEVSLIDSIHWRMPPSDPNRRGSSVRSGRRRVAPKAAAVCSKAAPAKPLSATMLRPSSTVVWQSASSA
jgi:hypothetical protein